MKTPTSPLTHASLRRLLLAAVLITSLPVLAVDYATLKLTGRWITPAGALMSYAGGAQTLAMNDKWIVVGSPYANEQAAIQGAVQVFNAATGAWVRKILPPGTPTATTYFGFSCAITGNLAAIGSLGPTGSTPGVVHIYNLTNGALLRTLAPAPGFGVNGDLFGYSVAISGRKVIIGALGDDASAGSAYIFNIDTGVQLAKIFASDGAAGHSFGGWVAAEGNIGIVAATNVDANRGAAYAFDLTTFAQISKLQPAASVGGDKAGRSVSIHQGKVVLGAPDANAGQGKVFVMNILTGSETVLTASDGAAGDAFGSSVSAHQGLLLVGAPSRAASRGQAYLFDLNSAATTEQLIIPPQEIGTKLLGYNVCLFGNNAVLGLPTDDAQATNSGAVYLLRPLLRKMPLVKVTAKGDYAPGAAEINFNLFGDVYMNTDSEIIFTASLTGAGAKPAHRGVWSTLAAGQSLDLVLKSGQADPPNTVAVVSNPLVNRAGLAIFRGLVTGTGITALNNQVIYKEDGLTASAVLRAGIALPGFGGALAQSFTQVTQTRTIDAIATSVALRQGVAATTAANDTGVLYYETAGVNFEGVREGTVAAATGVTYGQFTGRVAYFDGHMTYATAVAGDAAFNQAVFRKNGLTDELLISRKGDVAAGTVGAAFASFLGESIDDSEDILYRATLSGATPATNEGLWKCTTVPVKSLIMRKGEDLAAAVPSMPGIKIAKFIHFWQTWNQSMALVQLAGTGVNATNDQAILLYQTTAPVTGVLTVLMREGETAPGCDGATIGVISRVEVEPYWGHYLVLTTLTGAPAGTEQALFRGFSRKSLSAGQQTLRRPLLVLRKGQLFENQPSKIKSILLPTANLTAAGAGTTGLGRGMEESSGSVTLGDVALIIDFANGVRQVMTGIP